MARIYAPARRQRSRFARGVRDGWYFLSSCSTISTSPINNRSKSHRPPLTSSLTYFGSYKHQHPAPSKPPSPDDPRPNRLSSLPLNPNSLPRRHLLLPHRYHPPHSSLQTTSPKHLLSTFKSILLLTTYTAGSASRADSKRKHKACYAISRYHATSTCDWQRKRGQRVHACTWSCRAD